MFSVITWSTPSNGQQRSSYDPKTSLTSLKPSAEELSYLQSLGLFFNEPEPAIICINCGFALKADSDRVSRHLGEKHGLARKARLGLNKLINSLHLPDPARLPARQNGQHQHPHLALQRGAACLHCQFHSTSYKVLTQHFKKEHSAEIKPKSTGRWIRDHIKDDVLFQSWLAGDIHRATVAAYCTKDTL